MFSIALLLVFVELSYPENSVSRFINLPCTTDIYCKRLDSSLRCQKRRCQCGQSWRLVDGACVSNEDFFRTQKEKQAEVDSYAILSVLMPTIFVGTIIVVLSVCACLHIHKGNRELHREQRRECIRRNREAAAAERYATGKLEQETCHTRAVSPEDNEVYMEDSFSEDSDSDSGSRNIGPKFNDIRTIESDTITESPRSQQRASPSPSSSILSARSLDQRKASVLHPLNGLIQPTGLVPQSQAGYQANMRLLFRQRPASAVSLGADTAASHFKLKSRPASAISRLDTVVTRIPASAPSSETEEEETVFGNSMEGLKPAYKSDVSVTESLKRFSKNTNLPNGHLPSSIVRSGILKTGQISRKNSDNDSEIVNGAISHKSSVSSNSSVRFATELETSNKAFKKQSSITSSSSSSNNSVSTKRNLKRQISSTSVGSTSSPASIEGETLIEKIMRERSAKNINTRKLETPKPFAGHADSVPSKSILKPSGNKERQKKRSIIFASPERHKRQSQMGDIGDTNGQKKMSGKSKKSQSLKKKKSNANGSHSGDKNGINGKLNYGYALEADESNDTVSWVKVMVHN